MKRFFHLIVASAGLIATPLHADDSADCRQKLNLDLQIRGCTRVILADPIAAWAFELRADAYHAKGNLENAISDRIKAGELGADGDELKKSNRSASNACFFPFFVAALNLFRHANAPECKGIYAQAARFSGIEFGRSGHRCNDDLLGCCISHGSSQAHCAPRARALRP